MPTQMVIKGNNKMLVQIQVPPAHLNLGILESHFFYSLLSEY